MEMKALHDTGCGVDSGRTLEDRLHAFLQSMTDLAAAAIANTQFFERVARAKGEHVIRDITQVKRLKEEARQRQRFEDLSRAKSAFIATMSHELRTPLNSILGFAELLLAQRAGVFSEKQAHYLTHIRNAGKHLLQLISDILDLSRVEAGKFVLQPEPLPVAQTWGPHLDHL